MAKRDSAPDARALGEGVAAVYLPLDVLRPNPRNPRLHGAEVERLARTILRTTWGAPILAQRSTMRIIGGHGRLEAARMIAAGMVVDGIERGGPAHRFDRDAPAPLLLPVRLVDVSDAEADAMTLADNAKALQGTDDAAAVVAMATASFERDADVMRDMGYGSAELDAMVKAAGDAVLRDAPDAGDVEHREVIGDAPRERIEVEEDEAPVDRAEELRAKWNTAPGQLWAIPSSHGGEHRILCGDSTKAEDVSRVMAGDVAVWCWTDPPYGVEYVGKTADALVIENDGALDLPVLLRGAFAGIDAAVCDGAPIYIAHPAGALSYEFMTAWKTVGWRWHQTLAWVKQTFVLGHADYHYQHEPILYGWKGKNRRWYGGRDKRSVLAHDKPSRNGEHPTMKPVSLVADCLQNSSQPGDIGYEPFSGSGTTLVAAEQTGRRCRAIELAPKYVAVALERLAALGLEPRLVS